MMLKNNMTMSDDLIADLPIGVFDSGIGGLTLVNALKRLLPHESIVYFGDTAHLPYGEKSALLIQQYAQEITQFLLCQPCKAIAMACHTASAVAFDAVSRTCGPQVPMFNVVDPVIHALNRLYVENPQIRCGLIGTHQTVYSGVYTKKLKALGLPIHFKALAAPLLVPVIEFSAEEALIDLALAQYLSAPALSGISALVLGCTHYPLVQNRVEAFYASRDHAVELIDPSFACAQEMADFLKEKGWLKAQPDDVGVQVYLSDMSPWFLAGVERWLEASYHVQLGRVDSSSEIAF